MDEKKCIVQMGVVVTVSSLTKSHETIHDNHMEGELMETNGGWISISEASRLYQQG